MYSRLDKYTIDRIEGLVNEKALSTLKSSLQIIVNDMFDEGWDEEDVFEYLKGLVIDAIDDVVDNEIEE
jgi:hypothetical protein